MKLHKVELQGLREMIQKTSTEVLNTYKEANETSNQLFDTVFIGDSMIEYFKLHYYIPELKALNRGIAGATTKLILENLDIIFGQHLPKDIYVSIGSNDLVLLEATIDEAFYGVVQVFNTLKQRYPQAKINYLSTTPVIHQTHKLYKKIYIGGRTNGQLKSLNFKVMNYANEHDINYIHQFDSLLDEKGYLNSEFTADGIHLNSKGYEIYAKNIKRQFK